MNTASSPTATRVARAPHPLRILQLPVLVLNQATLISQALRQRGHRCDYLLFDLPPEDAHLHDQCDINLGLTAQTHWQRLKTIVRFLHRHVDDYDIFHFHSGRTFIPLMAFSRWSFVPNRVGRFIDFLDFLDLAYLKHKAKKIVFQFWGCDIRAPEFDRQYPDSACNVCPPEIQTVHCNRALKQKMNRLTRKYAHARISSGDLNVCFQDLRWVENIIDTDRWQPRPHADIPPALHAGRNGTIKIYHSFSKSDIRNDVKGTHYVFEAVEALKLEGHRVELMFFNYLPHDEIGYYQMQADIVVDQLKCGHYGNTAVECLSMGKPVICYLRPDVEAMMPAGHPIINANRRNLVDRLRHLVIDKQYRLEMGRRSRAFAVRNHGLAAVGQRLESIYYSLY